MASVEHAGSGTWRLANDALEIRVAAGEGVAVQVGLTHRGDPTVDWAAGQSLDPVVEVASDSPELDSQGLSFRSAEPTDGALCLVYDGPAGLTVRHFLQPAPDQPAWRSWTAVANDGDEPIHGLSRFDAVGLGVAVATPPMVAYLLGWMDGPRLDAPGHHAVPFAYPSWIPRLLYGDDPPVVPPPPAGGWTHPVLRLVREPLSRLPLRSGKRSTYENHPWLTLLDPERGGGLFAGFEWSGSWRLDVIHDARQGVVRLNGGTDGNVHTLVPGATLTSPPAFVGLFSGDFEDGFNASRRYVAGHVMPEPVDDFPPAHYNIGSAVLPRFSGSFLRDEVDLASELGFDRFAVDAMWWRDSADAGDFSIGLGDFRDSLRKFPDGLRALSEHVRARGMKFGLWFEFERVDLRTANRGPRPWSPAWLIHQRGHPYRSWCQHVYLLCLGVRAAADWALESLSAAIAEYGVEWMKIDGNEWAVCDDDSHDHGAHDGEWAQIHGLYHVLAGLRARFPDLIIENCAGGSQRGDFGMARYCRVMHAHDTHFPSAYNRHQAHGVGTLYPSSYGLRPLYNYPGETSPRRLQWRVLSRLMGTFQSRLELGRLSPADRQALERGIAFHKRLRPTLSGDRFVPSPPTALRAPDCLETDSWEVYQYLAPRGDLVSAFFYRCASPVADARFRLRGLNPDARYRIEWYSGGQAVCGGAELMSAGLACRIPTQMDADVALLTAIPAAPPRTAGA